MWELWCRYEKMEFRGESERGRERGGVHPVDDLYFVHNYVITGRQNDSNMMMTYTR